MDQKERLDRLVEIFKEDSVLYKDMETPKDDEGKRQLLRSLMNIRMPKAMPREVLELQDEYLKERSLEKGIVHLKDIPAAAELGSRRESADKLSIWLREECSRRMETLREEHGPDYEQPTAVPMLTDAYDLPAKKIVHIVGPIVSGELTKDLEEDLAACYRNTLDL